MAQIDARDFNEFQTAVFHRLEKIQDGIVVLDNRLVAQETVMQTLSANGGERGRVARLERAIDRIKNILWPVIGAIALLAWIGREGLKALFG